MSQRHNNKENTQNMAKHNIISKANNNLNKTIKIVKRVNPVIVFINVIFGIILIVSTMSYHTAQKKIINFQLKDAMPTFDAWYINLDNSAIDALWDEEVREEINCPPLGYPLLNIEDITGFIKSMKIENIIDINRGNSILLDYINQSGHGNGTTTFLIIEQKGKVQADDIQLEVETFNYSLTDMVFDASKQLSYEKVELYNNTFTSKKKIYNLGSLDTGKGVLIPLSVNIQVYDSMIVPFKVSYRPIKIIYRDSYNNKRKEYNIRDILDTPFMIGLYVGKAG